jgi:hypothetical protein
MRIRYVCLQYGTVCRERPPLRCSMCLRHPMSRQVRVLVRQSLVAINAINGSRPRLGRFRTIPKRRCLDVLFSLDVSCASLLLQDAALCLHLSLANFNNLVAKRSSDLLKSLVPCLPADGVNKRSETVALSDIVRTYLIVEGLGLGLCLTYGK